MAQPATSLIPTTSDPGANRSPSVLASLWVLTAVSTVVLAGRIWTKATKTHRLYYDDGLMVVAWILGLIYAGLITTAVHYGLGKHFMTLGFHDQKKSNFYGVLSLTFGNLSPMAGRVAFCVTMLFLARTDPRVYRWPIYVFIVCQILFNLAMVTFFLAQCGLHLAVLTSLDYELIGEYCTNPEYQTDFGHFVGSFNCVTDVFLTLLPALLIKHTRLSLKKQLGLAALLCLSVLALAAAIVKTYEAKALSQTSDYTYDLCWYVIALTVELNIVIVVASVPLLRRLFHRSSRHHQQQQQQETPAAR